MGDSFAKALHSYESGLFRDFEAHFAENSAKSALAARNRWIAAQNEFGELKVLAAQVHYDLCERINAEKRGAEFNAAFESWTGCVKAIAEAAPVPENYVKIDGIQGRRASYTNATTGRTQALKPEVAATQKWIDFVWKKHAQQLGAQWDSPLKTTLGTVGKQHYFLTHRCIGSALIDRTGVDEIHDALSRLHNEIDERFK